MFAFAFLHSYLIVAFLGGFYFLFFFTV